MKKGIYNILGFIGYCFREKLILISLLGYIMMIISPIFSWYSSALAYEGVDEKFDFNMFQLAGGQIKERAYIAFGIFIILFGVGLVVIEYFDYRIMLRERLRIILPVEVLLYIALVLLVVFALNNETLRETMSYRSGEVKALEYWIKDASGHCNNGVGPAVFFVGFGLDMLTKVGIYIYYFVDNVKDSLTARKG